MSLKFQKDILFSKNVLNNIDDGKCHIKPTLQVIILNYGKINNCFNTSQAFEIAQSTSMINPEGLSVSQSNMWAPLIWNALKYVGYDVKPECLIVKLKTEDDCKLFDDAVKQLASLTGWADYAVNILVNDNHNYNDCDNDFYSEIVINKTKYYTNDYTNDYKQKYIKYKHKYLKLSKIKNSI
jgi:hypothetical protein